MGFRIVMWATAWMVSVEPSEPVPWTFSIMVEAKLLRLKLAPSQKVDLPVNVGWLGSKGVKVKLPVMVTVIQPVPAPIPDVRNVA